MLRLETLNMTEMFAYDKYSSLSEKVFLAMCFKVKILLKLPDQYKDV